jgi:hypothetical protein
MSLSDWQKNGWLKPHPPDSTEIAAKLQVIERDVRFSGTPDADPDWRFAAAYNAALQGAAIAWLASGFEASKGGGAHYYTIESLKFTVADNGALIDALQAFRGKRGGMVYEAVVLASD